MPNAEARRLDLAFGSILPSAFCISPSARPVALLLLDLGHFLHASDVAALAEGGGEEDLGDLTDGFFTEKVGAEAEHVTVIVFARPAGGDFVVNQGSSNVVNLVGGDGHADAAAVHQDGDVGAAVGYGAGRRGSKVRVVAGGGALAAVIGDFVPLLLQHRQQPALGLESPVITGNRDFHVDRYLVVSADGRASNGFGFAHHRANTGSPYCEHKVRLYKTLSANRFSINVRSCPANS